MVLEEAEPAHNLTNRVKIVRATVHEDSGNDCLEGGSHHFVRDGARSWVLDHASVEPQCMTTSSELLVRDKIVADDTGPVHRAEKTACHTSVSSGMSECLVYLSCSES